MLGVAVGCGLVAAVAVAKLSAGGSKGPETAKVLVAKKDLPVQTALDEKELDGLLQWADMPKGLVPPDAVTDLEQVKGKSLNRTLKQGNPVSVTDLGTLKNLILPDGYKGYSLKVNQTDVVSGFAKPGSRVDIMFVERMQSGKTRSGIILKDMLVLALNQTNTLDEKTGVAIMQVESVTLAVTDSHVRLLALAAQRGTLQLVLRSPNQVDVKPLKEGEIEWLEDPFIEKEKPQIAVAPPKMDQVVMARKAVPVNTLVNADNVGEFFTTLEVKAAPEGVVQNPDDLKGLYVTKPLAEGQFLYKSLTGSEMAKIEKSVETKPADPVKPVEAEPKTQPTPAAVVEKKKLPRFEQFFQEGGKAVKVIWLEVAPDKWKRFDSEKDADAYQPEPEAPKADGDKGEKSEGPKADQ